MTTSEIKAVTDRFAGQAQLAKAAGLHAEAATWFRAAELLTEAECASITASFDRGLRRKKLGLRATR